MTSATNRIARILLALLFLALIPAVASAQQPAARPAAGPRFTPNIGQIVDTDGMPRPDIRYVAESNGVTLYLGDNRISYVFSEQVGDPEHHDHADGNAVDGIHDEGMSGSYLKLYRTDLQFIGASAMPAITSQRPLASYTNYYLAHRPEGILRVPSFGNVTYRDLYPGIDLVVHTEDTGLKYDFVVRPGGRVSDIRMRYVAASSQRIDLNGNLVTTTPLGAIDEEAPYTFQEMASAVDGAREIRRAEIPSRFRLVDGVISFDVAAYDSSRTLVIDPTQRWSTYYGGTGAEDLNGGDVTEIDRSGNVLITGSTSSTNFPTSPGAFSSTQSGQSDIIVVKMNSAGELLWATLYGGSAQDLAHGIVSDRDGNVFIAGHTVSSNFPTLNAHQRSLGGERDAFAVKFDEDGMRQWATYYGGASFDDSYGFAIDSSGNPAMILTTGSNNAIATSGAFDVTLNTSNQQSNTYDAAIVKFDSDGTRLWGTYVGGTGVEYGYGAATDIDANINITGWTNSPDFPVTSGTHQTSNNGGYDAFVARFNSDGEFQWGTYFGGSGNENNGGFGSLSVGYAAIATDGNGNPIITGGTTSTSRIASSLQTTYGGGAGDAFVAKFNNQGNRIWSTYIGGSGADIGQGIAVGGGNAVYVTGNTSSANFPVTSDAFQTRASGGIDAFIIKIDSAGRSIDYGTYYGGPGSDQGIGISADASGSFVVAGSAAAGLPVSGDAHQPTYGGGNNDVYIAYFCDIESRVDTSGPTRICEGDSLTLSAPAGYESYLWQSRTDPAIAASNKITVRDTGVYWVRISNSAGCVVISDTIQVTACAISGARDSDAGLATTLDRIRPNPASGSTTIEYRIAQSGRTRILLVDRLGTTIPILDATIDAGRHVAHFDASALPSGLYFCILESGTQRLMQGVAIVK